MIYWPVIKNPSRKRTSCREMARWIDTGGTLRALCSLLLGRSICVNRASHSNMQGSSPGPSSINHQWDPCISHHNNLFTTSLHFPNFIMCFYILSSCDWCSSSSICWRKLDISVLNTDKQPVNHLSANHRQEMTFAQWHREECLMSGAAR